MDGHGRSENNNHNIDVGKLTKEAEAGHGHYVGSVLDQMSFEEQIRIAHQIAICSTEHSKLAGFPKVDVCVRAASGDEQSAQGYSNLQVYRETSKDFGIFPRAELIYESSLNLTTGEKITTDNNR
jgi:hypothetical protein